MTPARQRRVVIVGGGFTGLSAAHALTHARRDVAVTLVERSPRLGGKVFSEHRDGGFLLEAGADSWLAAKPAATKLAQAVGVGTELIGTNPKNRRVYVVWNNRMHPLPEGVVLGVPTRVMPMVRTGLFSLGAKLRMGLEPLVPRRAWDGDEDESIADFVTRRLGREACDRLAAPLLGGIYAGDANELSVRAALPQFVQAERAHGSLVRAMRGQKRPPATAGAGDKSLPASAFVTLRGGMGSFVDAVAAALPAGTVRTSTGVKAVRSLGPSDARGRWAVDLETSEETLFADDVILAVPSSAASHALRPIDEGLAAILDPIPFVSTAAVTLAVPRSQVPHALDATGYIVPRVLGLPVLAATWISSKWEGRAPADAALIRVFLGGAGRPEGVEQEDAELIAVAVGELEARIGFHGTPIFTRVFRFPRSSPQPLVGHLVRMRSFRERLARWPGLHAGGGGYESVGVPACIEQGQQIAAAVLAASSSVAGESPPASKTDRQPHGAGAM